MLSSCSHQGSLTKSKRDHGAHLSFFPTFPPAVRRVWIYRTGSVDAITTMIWWTTCTCMPLPISQPFSTKRLSRRLRFDLNMATLSTLSTTTVHAEDLGQRTFESSNYHEDVILRGRWCYDGTFISIYIGLFSHHMTLFIVSQQSLLINPTYRIGWRYIPMMILITSRSFIAIGQYIYFTLTTTDSIRLWHMTIMTLYDSLWLYWFQGIYTSRVLPVP